MNCNLNWDIILSLVPYYGGKARQADITLDFIQMVAEYNRAHSCLECFGGGGRFLLNLNRIPHPLGHLYYNEWDEAMCCLFYVVSDYKLAEQFYERVMMERYDRSNFYYWRNRSRLDKRTGLVLDRSLTIMDKAVAAYMTCHLSFNAGRKHYSDSRETDFVPAHIERIWDAAYQLEHLKVRQGDYKKPLVYFGSDPQVVKLLDPPYHPVCREKGANQVYRCEMSRKQHLEMVEVLCESRSWILSGYDPELWGCADYKPLVASGAVKVCIGEYDLSSASTSQHRVELLKKLEFIWYKF